MLYFDYSSQPQGDLAIENDPAELLPTILDQLITLGQMAQQLSQALGGNGDRPEKATEVIRQLVNERR